MAQLVKWGDYWCCHRIHGNGTYIYPLIYYKNQPFMWANFIIHGSYGVVFMVYRSVFFRSGKKDQKEFLLVGCFFWWKLPRENLRSRPFYQQQVFETFGDLRAFAEVKKIPRRGMIMRKKSPVMLITWFFGVYMGGMNFPPRSLCLYSGILNTSD